MKDRMEAFVDHLIDKGKAASTAKKYATYVACCLKKKDVDEYIENIKSASHRSFVKSAWASWEDFCISSRSQDDVKSFLHIVQLVDVEMLLQARISKSTKTVRDVMYFTEKGVLTLTEEQNKIVSKFSNGDNLVHL